MMETYFDGTVLLKVYLINGTYKARDHVVFKRCMIDNGQVLGLTEHDDNIRIPLTNVSVMKEI